MHDTPFIDAHVHLWDLSRIHYPWLTPPFSDDGPNGSVAPIAANYLPVDYARESADWNVVGMVHVEAGAAPAQALAETQWLQAMADHGGRPDVIVAFAALDDPEVERLLAAHAAHSRVRGIRHIVNWHPDPARTYTPRDVTRDTAWERGFGLLQQFSLSFDLQAYPLQFAHLAQLIARHEHTPVIVNHAGMGVDLDDAGIALWRSGMQALARLPNVSVKLSGFGFVWKTPDAARIRARVHEILDLFGAGRVMMASDFPTDRLFASFNATLGVLHAAVADLSAGERHALFAGNANRIYRLDLPLPNAGARA